MTSYVKPKCLLQKRNSIRNVLHPTRNLCYFRYKSYGPLCDFHKSGDLDLDFYPISKKKTFVSSLNQNTSYVKKSVQWCGLNIANRRTNRQTNRQTDRGDQYTLQKSTILQSNYGQTNTYVTDTTKWTVKMARRNLTTYTNKHTNYMDKQTHKLWTNRHTNYGQTDTQIMDKQTHMLRTQLSGL